MEKDRAQKIDDLTKFLKEGLLEEELNSLMENLGDSAAEPIATSEDTPEELQPQEDNNDSHPSDEHDQEDEVEGIVVEDVEFSDEEVNALEEEIEFFVEEEGLLNEGATEFVGAKIISKIIGIMPNAIIDRTFAKMYAKLEADDKKKYKKVKFDRKMKVRILRGVLRKAYADSRNKPKIDNAAKNILRKKGRTVTESAAIVGAAGIAASVGGILSIMAATLGSAIIGAVFAGVVGSIATKQNRLYEAVNTNKDEGEQTMEKIKLEKENLEPNVEPTPDPDKILEDLDSTFESMFSILENSKLGDVAAMPVATDEVAPQEMTPQETNDGVFGSDEHEQKEEVKEVIVEGIEGDTDLGQVAKDGNEATQENSDGSMKEPTITNTDSHPADEHEQKEEVKEVIVEEEKPEVTKGAEEEVEEFGELNDAGSNTLDSKGELASQPEPVKVNEEKVSDTAEAVKVEVADHGKTNDAGSDTLDSNGELVTQPKQVQGAPAVVSEGIEGDTDLGQVAKDGNEATVEGSDGSAKEPTLDNSASHPADEHEQKEEVKEVVVEAIEGDTKLGDAAPKETATVEETPSDKEPTVNNDSLHPSDEHAQKEEVKEVVVEAIEGDTDLGQVAKDKNEATIEGSDGSAKEPTVTNTDSHPADEHEQKEEIKEVIVEKKELPEALKKNTKDDKDDDDKVPEKLEDGSKDEDHDEKSDDDGKDDKKADKDKDDKKEDKKCDKCEKSPCECKKEDLKESIEGDTDLGQVAKDKNEATAENSDGSAKEPTITNTDSHPADEHEQKEEVKEVIVEAIEGDTDLGQVAKDGNEATVEGSTGSEATATDSNVNLFPADEHKQSEEVKEVIVESKTYNSLKEAFLLDEDYFVREGYVKVSASDKQNKLQEQMSLLLAREVNDPMYEELLEATILAKKLNEEIKAKYEDEAKKKAKQVMDLKGKKTEAE